MILVKVVKYELKVFFKKKKVNIVFQMMFIVKKIVKGHRITNPIVQTL